jgi:hypothetical protein
MPKPAVHLLLGVCLLCSSVVAVAAELTGTLKAIRDRGAVVIGHATDANLMSFVGPDGKPSTSARRSPRRRPRLPACPRPRSSTSR